MTSNGFRASFLRSPKTSNISGCKTKKKKKKKTFRVAVNNSIKVGLLVFLLQMFVIMEEIMKRLLYVVCFLLGNSPASEFYMPTFWNTLLSVPFS
jgi:hypothetical protein